MTTIAELPVGTEFTTGLWSGRTLSAKATFKKTSQAVSGEPDFCGAVWCENDSGIPAGTTCRFHESTEVILTEESVP